MLKNPYARVALIILAVVVGDYIRWAMKVKGEKLFSKESLMYYWHYGFLFHPRIHDKYTVKPAFFGDDTKVETETITLTNDGYVLEQTFKQPTVPAGQTPPTDYIKTRKTVISVGAGGYKDTYAGTYTTSGDNEVVTTIGDGKALRKQTKTPTGATAQAEQSSTLTPVTE